jgi:hypothetical protein
MNTNSLPSRTFYRRNLSRTFKELLKQAECPEIRFHDLRHTAATLMVADGVPIKVVADSSKCQSKCQIPRRFTGGDGLFQLMRFTSWSP